MAGLGVEVADAYIDVHASSEKVRQDLRRLSRTALPELADQLERAFDVDKAADRAQDWRRFRKELADVANGSEWDRLRNQYSSLKDFEDDVNERLRLMSTQIHGINGQFSKTAISRAEAAKLQERLTDFVTRERKELEAMALPLEERWVALKRISTETGRMAKEFRQVDIILRRMHGLSSTDTFNGPTQAEILKAERIRRRSETRLVQFSKKAWSTVPQHMRQEFERSYDGMRSSWRRLVRHQSRDYDRFFVGRLRGSRNNFLNFLGRMFGPVESLVGRLLSGPIVLLDNAMHSIVKLIQGDGTNQARNLLGGLLSTVSSGLSGIAVTAGVAVIGLGAVMVALGPFVSLLSSTAALLTAIAGSLALGLGGLGVSLLPLLGGLAAGIGAVVVAFQGMSDEQKAALDPIKAWFDEIKGVVADNLFGNLQSQVENLMPVLEEFVGPLLEDTATALSGAIDDFIAQITRPDFQNTLNTLNKTLPNISGNLATSIGSVITGVLGFMSAVAPQVEQISEDIDAALADWSAWVNSAEGQNSVADWFDRAWNSATLLWNLLTTVWELLGTIFDAGQDTGDSWLSDFTADLQSVIDYLQSPEGQQAMEEWFDRAERLWEKLEEVGGAVGRMWAALDTEQSFQMLEFVLDALEGMIDFLTEVGERAQIVALTFARWTSNAITDIESVVTWIKGIPGALSGAWEAFKTWLGDLWQNIVDWFAETDWATVGQNIIDGIVEGLVPEPVREAFKLVIDNVVQWVKDLLGISSPSTVFKEIGLDVIAGLIEGLVPDGLISAASDLVEGLVGEFEKFKEDPVQYVKDGIDKITNLFTGGSSSGSPITRAGSTLVTTLKNAWNDFTTGPPKVVSDTLEKVRNTIATKGLQAQTATRGAINGILKEFNSFSGGRRGSPSSQVETAMSTVAREISNGMSVARSRMRTGVNNLLGEVSGLGSRVRSRAGSTSLYGVGADMMAGLARGISANAYRAYNAAYSAALSAASGARRGAQIHSPSRVFRDIGEFMLEGMADGMTRNERLVVQAAERLIDAVTDPFSEANLEAQGKAAAAALARGLDAAPLDPVTVSAINAAGGRSLDNVGAPGRSVVIEEGAIALSTPATDPTQAAEALLDRLAVRMG